MSPCEIRPTDLLAKFRSHFRQVVQPGRVLDAVQVCDLQREFNTAYEVTRDFEEEFAILSDIPTPEAPGNGTATGAVVLQFRPKPRFHVVIGGPGGGDAA